jgi:hypothetical protein
MADESNVDHADLRHLEPPLIPLVAMVGGVLLEPQKASGMRT